METETIQGNRVIAEWVPYESVDFANENFNNFSIDTRDFHCIVSNRDLPKIDMHNTAKNPDWYFFKPEELRALIDRYFNESGGKAEWRMFSLEGYCEGWEMKYLRIFRTKRGLILCTSFRDEYKLHKKKNLNRPVRKKYLDTH